MRIELTSSAWKAVTLTIVLYSHLVRMKGLEPPRIAPPDSKSGLSTIPTHPENLESPFDDPVTSFNNMVNEICGGGRYRPYSFGFSVRCNHLICHSSIRPHLGIEPSFFQKFGPGAPKEGNTYIRFELPLRFELRLQDYKSSVLTN